MTPKILLVDDEAAICHLIKLHFQTEGYLVYTASDAEEAAGMLSHTPDLILLDINMPEVDGLEFCKKVRNHIDCPIIFLTSRITVTDDGKGFSAQDRAEAVNYFYKGKKEKEHFGIGLTICKILAEKHGGSISLDNATEGGARVSVELEIK